MPETPKERKKSDSDNIVFIGNKPLINYVKSVSMQLKITPEVIIKARGKFITKAVDILEVVKRSNDSSIQIKGMQTGTEEYHAADELGEMKKIRVSTLDITLTNLPSLS